MEQNYTAARLRYILRTKSQGPYGKHTQTPKR
jgi:hypothetical protein